MDGKVLSVNGLAVQSHWLLALWPDLLGQGDRIVLLYILLCFFAKFAPPPPPSLSFTHRETWVKYIYMKHGQFMGSRILVIIKSTDVSNIAYSVPC